MGGQTPRVGNLWRGDDRRRTYRGMAFWISELWHLSVAGAYATNIAFGNDDTLDLAAKARREAQTFTASDRSGSTYEIDVSASMQEISAVARPGGPYDLETAFYIQVIAVVAQLGDALQYASEFEAHKRDPLLQFLRHLRNGVAHGGYWHFDQRIDFEKSPAVFNGIELSHDLNGTPVREIFAFGDYALMMATLSRFFHDLADTAGEASGTQEVIVSARVRTDATSFEAS